MTVSLEYLDKIADEYHLNSSIPDMHIENLCQEYFIEWLLPHIHPGMRVLELGYGDGVVTEALTKTGCELFLLEGSQKLIKLAEQKYPTVQCVHTLFEEFQTNTPFDLILAAHVLEHVDKPVVALKNMSSWLSENGKLIIVVPNKNSIHRQLAVTMGLQPELDTLSKRDLMVGHQRVYSFDTLEDDIQKANMKSIDSVGFFLKVLPNSMMLDYSRELLSGLNKISPLIPKDLLANIAVVAKKI